MGDSRILTKKKTTQQQQLLRGLGTKTFFLKVFYHSYYPISMEDSMAKPFISYIERGHTPLKYKKRYRKLKGIIFLFLGLTVILSIINIFSRKRGQVGICRW
jgi:hypothetical protein